MKKIIKNEGFTLIELLVVVAIIAILALIVLLAINPAEMARRSRDARRESDMTTVRKAVDLALADGKTLVDTSGWQTLNATTGDVTKFAGMAGFDVSKYLSVVPQDPIMDGTGKTQVVNADCSLTPGVADSAMTYQFKSDGNVYELRTRLESVDNCSAVKNMPNADGYYKMGIAPGLNM